MDASCQFSTLDADYRKLLAKYFLGKNKATFGKKTVPGGFELSIFVHASVDEEPGLEAITEEQARKLARDPQCQNIAHLTSLFIELDILRAAK